MSKLYVTYGWGSNLRNNYSVVEAPTEMECHEKVDEVCGRDYAFTYRDMKSAGIEEYKLTEVPLQAQRILS